jgi:hypothetical protein
LAILDQKGPPNGRFGDAPGTAGMRSLSAFRYREGRQCRQHERDRRERCSAAYICFPVSSYRCAGRIFDFDYRSVRSGAKFARHEAYPPKFFRSRLAIFYLAAIAHVISIHGTCNREFFAVDRLRERAHCFNSREARVVTFMQRGKNDFV